ncbi:hypothetical protein [Massilia genomosp. 1]|uniref:Uncharacterized protein n=1 Tax=Massilia genomosp. 1 TaxID=2609280 RepID=A0ABX0MUF6_9BURK|nr:hypothetical protein [Massilia genomosp. 1]NHZ62929.1 hypothetical protein [Massilia genomosp. 1]
MSKQTAAALKLYFLTGSIPTQDHFAALIDSGVNLLDAKLTIDARQRLGIGCTPTSTLSVQSQYNLALSGSVSTTNGSATVLGTQTRFTAETTVGAVLSIAGGLYTVSAIASDTSLSIDPAFPPAPVPVASQAPALADAGVSLKCADAAGRTRLELRPDGALQVGALQVGAVTAAGSVSAAAFSGDGAGLRNIPVGALTGTFSAAQIPDIPMSKVVGNLAAARIGGVLSAAQLPPIPAATISGQLAVAQIPDLSSREVLLYASAPLVPKGTRTSVSWLADYGYQLTLVFLGANGPSTLPVGPGPGSYTLLVNQRTLFTLTATSATGVLKTQRQIWIDTY